MKSISKIIVGLKLLVQRDKRMENTEESRYHGKVLPKKSEKREWENPIFENVVAEFFKIDENYLFQCDSCVICIFSVVVI